VHTLVEVTFALLWSVVLFVVVEFAARRFFALARQRATVASLAAGAYLLGAFVSPLRQSAPPVSVSGAAVAPPTAAPAPRDASAQCPLETTAKLPIDAVGSFDGASDSFDRASIRNGGVVKAGHGVTVTGWAIANDGSAVAGGVCLDVDRKIARARVIYGILRPDVAAATKKPALQPSGFEISIPRDALRRGNHVLRIIVIEPEGDLAALGETRRLTVR